MPEYLKLKPFSCEIRHVRLLKPLFQDCLMQEKAAEFGKAFNAVPFPNPEPRTTTQTLKIGRSRSVRDACVHDVLTQHLV